MRLARSLWIAESRTEIAVAALGVLLIVAAAAGGWGG